MPALSTIKAWLSASDCDGKSGFCQQTIISLRKLVQDQADGECPKKLYVSLCFDEIAIRRRIDYNHGQRSFSGLIEIGKRKNQECFIANNAIFFLITCIETGRSLILGYFLIRTLNTNEKFNLLKDAIAVINETNACLVSVSFDGLPVNFAVCRTMGACFDLDNMKPYILNNGNKVVIVLDPPHMLKLIRNCLATKNQIVSHKLNVIRIFSKI